MSNEAKKIYLDNFPVGRAKLLNYGILQLCVVRGTKDVLTFFIVDE